MNIKNIKHMAHARLHTTRIGRTLCRLAGEESGQTAMEYVVIATLICAAIAVGIWMFGAQILAMFNTSSQAVTGDHQNAKENTVAQRSVAEQAAKDATKVDKEWTTAEEKANKSVFDGE